MIWSKIAAWIIVFDDTARKKLRKLDRQAQEIYEERGEICRLKLLISHVLWPKFFSVKCFQ